MGAFGDLDVRMGPWDVDYGAEAPLQSIDPLAAEEVHLDVETPSADWTPVQPALAATPSRLIFVDGVRRLEARLMIRRGNKVCHGGFGTYAVGSVVVSGGVAHHDQAIVDRLVVIGSGESMTDPVAPLHGFPYRPISTVAPEPDGPLQAIHDEMRMAEERLARTLSDRADTLVIADGPLTFEDPVRGSVVGYIKRLFKLYVPDRHLGLLAQLTPGARTPLFGLRATRRFARYAWFARLAAPQVADSELSGIVRLEVSESVGLERARTIADLTTRLLPRFAPGRSRDPRSPQNLLPIGALEALLRRRMGDARLIRRHIESLVAREVRNGQSPS